MPFRMIDFTCSRIPSSPVLSSAIPSSKAITPFARRTTIAAAVFSPGDGDLIARPQRAQIAADAGLVSDDEGVLRVGLPRAALTGGRGPMDRQAGAVGDRLAGG